MNRVLYGRITSLTWDERPIETIEGLVSGGSINLDGDSAVRRSCSLQMLTTPKDYKWVLKTKFRLEIGVSEDGGPVEWYRQGTFVITSFSTSLSTNNCTINISGQDKMGLLNGEIGGVLNAEHDFGQWEQQEEDGSITLHRYPIKDIIREAVHKYGGEPYHNIIINDLDEAGMELLEYKYDTSLYLIRPAKSYGRYYNGTLNSNTQISLNGVDTINIGSLDETQYDYLVKNLLTQESEPAQFMWGNELCSAAKIDYGETVGYRATELIYPKDLIVSAGSSITTLLDTIKKFLGNFEYFYDVDGRFIFREKLNYVNNTWIPLSTSENGEQFFNPNLAEPIQFNFSGNELITTLNLAPNLKDVKNDFTVWGSRKTSAGSQIPIHMRLAIDVKPYGYTTLDGRVYKSNNITSTTPYVSFDPEVDQINDNVLFNIQGSVNNDTDTPSIVIQSVDWREVIYQMALDYIKHQSEDDFELKVAKANPNLFPYGRTGYEQYYTDMEGYWRQLYNPNEVNSDEYYKPGTMYAGWNKDIITNPTVLNFWFDFLSGMDEFSVRTIGSRPKVIKEDTITAIAYFDTPNIQFVSSSHEETVNGNAKFQLPIQYEDMFSISTQGKSAYERIEELVYNHAYCAENLTINCIPIYTLEPNRRIYVNDPTTGANGEYIPTKITIPLTYNGTMSITASKAIPRIL